MKDFRYMTVGALCFCTLSLVVPQVDALNTRGGQGQTLESSIQQRVTIAQQEMNANAMALAIAGVEGSIKDNVKMIIRQTLLEFARKLVMDFNPTLEQTCHRVVQQAAEVAEGGQDFDVDARSNAFAQLEKQMLKSDTCDSRSVVSFEPTGVVSGSFLEQRGFWDTLKTAGKSLSVFAEPLVNKVAQQMGNALKNVLEEQIGPELRKQVEASLNKACDKAIEEEENAYN